MSSQRQDKHDNGANALPCDDLSEDKLLATVPRLDFQGRACPALGGIPLLKLIGRGGMSCVYLGYQIRLQRTVAVKVLLLHVAERHPSAVARFQREARLAARIESPHLVRVHDIDQEGPFLYLVMEYVTGETAFDRLCTALERGAPGLPESDALDICIAACTGLAAAHAEGIIHRDVKPNNMLIPLDKRTLRPNLSGTKLADLGLARVEAIDDSELTRAGAFLGTPGYMAPEQVDGAKLCLKSADVFGLGASLYSLLSGRAPFDGESSMKTLYATVHTPHTPLRETRKGVSRATAKLIDRCLQKTPTDRPQDASTLLVALTACRAGLNRPQPEQELDDDDLALSDEAYAPPPVPVTLPPQSKQRVLPHFAWPTLPPQARRLALLAAGALCVLALGYFVLRHVGGESRYPAALKEARETVARLDHNAASREQAEEAIMTVLRLRPNDPEALSLLDYVGLRKQLTLDLPHGATLDLVLIKPGTFEMGSPENEFGHQSDETPHAVTLGRQYYLSVTEVTQQQYEAVMGANPSQFKAPKNPVESVAWDDAIAFCDKLNALVKTHLPTDMRVQLPTEAQWERACRAGSTTPFHTGATIDSAAANFNGREAYGSGKKGLDRRQTTPTGSFEPNAFGLYDMHGNVWEWCADWYGAYVPAPAVDPTGPPAGTERVLRGGAWTNIAENCRSACRNHATPGTRLPYIGFRIAIVPTN
jgi:formylglycine-generating enzyme required for sulfatase activity/serine/threonine protein kinase